LAEGVQSRPWSGPPQGRGSTGTAAAHEIGLGRVKPMALAPDVKTMFSSAAGLRRHAGSRRDRATQESGRLRMGN